MFKVDFRNGKAEEWHRKGGEVRREVVENYFPRIYVSGRQKLLENIRPEISSDEDVRATVFEDWKTELGKESEKVLRVDVKSIDQVRKTAYRIRRGNISRLKLYNVDFSPQFRYCLEEEVEPVTGDLEKISLGIDEESLGKREVTGLRLDGKKIGEEPGEVIERLDSLLEERDPDILAMNSSEIVPLVHDKSNELGAGTGLGRREGYRKLAGKNSFESYGRVGYSPARYSVPGRVIIDRDNSFFMDVTSVRGMLDLVERSWKPLQELSWASIGNVLTAIESRKAFLEKEVLVPWNKWEPEDFKSVETLYSADRGGFIFSPETGFHEDVHELDFSSMYPNIMIERNVSPETVRCSCCSNEEVPGLDYSICEKKGFIPEVLEPLVEDREKIKEKIEQADDEVEKKELESRSNAIKWILVSCFGYQGYRNAKFGRIEAHEAINAYAREIMLQTKKVFEENGYRIIHGIIDSIWAKKVEEDAPGPGELAERVTGKIGIELEHEKEYSWIAFVPRRNTETGALNRYFGKHGEGFKTRGIEMRQRSTCKYVKYCQEMMLKSLDRNRDPEKVLEVLRKQIVDLEGVEIEDLIIKRRASRKPEDYNQETLTVAALERYRKKGLEKNPGEDVEFIVSDSSKDSLDRVRIPLEDPGSFDRDFYVQRLVRAAESILSPMGWRRERIRKYLEKERASGIDAFV